MPGKNSLGVGSGKMVSMLTHTFEFMCIFMHCNFEVESYFMMLFSESADGIILENIELL